MVKHGVMAPLRDLPAARARVPIRQSGDSGDGTARGLLERPMSLLSPRGGPPLLSNGAPGRVDRRSAEAIRDRRGCCHDGRVRRAAEESHRRELRAERADEIGGRARAQRAIGSPMIRLKPPDTCLTEQVPGPVRRRLILPFWLKTLFRSSRSTRPPAVVPDALVVVRDGGRMVEPGGAEAIAAPARVVHDRRAEVWNGVLPRNMTCSDLASSRSVDGHRQPVRGVEKITLLPLVRCCRELVAPAGVSRLLNSRRWRSRPFAADEREVVDRHGARCDQRMLTRWRALPPTPIVRARLAVTAG